MVCVDNRAADLCFAVGAIPRLIPKKIFGSSLSVLRALGSFPRVFRVEESFPRKNRKNFSGGSSLCPEYWEGDARNYESFLRGFFVKKESVLRCRTLD